MEDQRTGIGYALAREDFSLWKAGKKSEKKGRKTEERRGKHTVRPKFRWRSSGRSEVKEGGILR